MKNLYYCPYCGEIYDNLYVESNRKANHIACPKGSCYGTIFEVDENMVYILKILNEKGYTTTHHCAGHAYEHYSYDVENKIFLGSYIIFDADVKFADSAIKSLPECWILKRDTDHMTSGYELRLSFPFDKDRQMPQYSNAVLHAGISNALLMLLKWVIELDLCGWSEPQGFDNEEPIGFGEYIDD